MKISTDKLYYLCNKYQWFTNGDRRQYDLLFKLNRDGATLEKLATIIWFCSIGYDEQDILKILQQDRPMTNLNLTANGKAQELILTYLQENASDFLAEKVNNGVIIIKDGKRLINKKNLDGFMKFACDEAKELAEKGTNCACIDDDIVYDWAIHYFEEDSIEGKLFNEDGSEYKPEPKTKPKATPTVPYTPPKPKPEPQLSMFDMLSEKPAESPVKDDDEDDEENDGEELNADYTPEELEEIHAEEEEKCSPIYQSYLAVKEKYNDGIVLYRLGDFYEMFGSDAITVANELNLTLTGRDCGIKERVPMAGIPFHAADVYISKLVSRGYKVIVAESLDRKTERTIERVIKPNPSEPLKLVDEETGEIISEAEMQKFDGDIEEPEELIGETSGEPEQDDFDLEKERERLKAFDKEALCILSDLLGDIFILE